MHNLTGNDFLSGIVRDLKMEYKELLYFLSLQIKLYQHLIQKRDAQAPLTLREKEFIELYEDAMNHQSKTGTRVKRQNKKWAASVSDYRCCPLKICFDPFSDRMKESNFLILFVGCALLRLFKILAGRVHIEFNFPKLLRILPDGFELGIGFGMLLFQSGIRNFRNEKSWIPVAL